MSSYLSAEAARSEVCLPTIAVIIAAKNASAFIAACLDSVLAQALPSDWQLQVLLGVDGCYHTACSAAPYRDRILIRHSELSVGPYSVFNTLAALTQAEVIARFDADDVMLPGYLASHLYVLRSAVSTLQIVRSWSIYTDHLLMPCQARLADGSFTGLDGRRRRGSDGQFTMTSAVWRRLGGFREWPFNADTEFLTRARAAGFQIADVPCFSYLRRVHADSLTANPQSDYSSAARRAFEAFTARERLAFSGGANVPRIVPTMQPLQELAALRRNR